MLDVKRWEISRRCPDVYQADGEVWEERTLPFPGPGFANGVFLEELFHSIELEVTGQWEASQVQLGRGWSEPLSPPRGTAFFAQQHYVAEYPTQQPWTSSMFHSINELRRGGLKG